VSKDQTDTRPGSASGNSVINQRSADAKWIASRDRTTSG
jgi:hypothetical protein